MSEFYRRSVAAAERITDSFEIVFVDDGSPDDALECLLRSQASNKRVKLVELSRDFGHHKAIFAGPSQYQGERIFVLDSDLEEAPSGYCRFINGLWLKIRIA